MGTNTALLEALHHFSAIDSVVAGELRKGVAKAPRSWPSSSQTTVNWPTKLGYVSWGVNVIAKYVGRTFKWGTVKAVLTPKS